jgi:protein SCO1
MSTRGAAGAAPVCGLMLGLMCGLTFWLVTLVLTSQAWAQGASSAPVQNFVAPAPGSYSLPAIQPAADGWVLEASPLPRRLKQYTHGALTLLSFIYTYCTDPIGCPLAYATFDTVKRRVLADPALRGQVRLVSLSFDPLHDTPQAMRQYGGEHARSLDLPWHFLTTRSMRVLQPILEDFGQDVDIELDATGSPTRARAHMLKVFLLDRQGQVREIYSAAFLHPDVIVNDLRTLALEAGQRVAAP